MFIGGLEFADKRQRSCNSLDKFRGELEMYKCMVELFKQGKVSIRICETFNEHVNDLSS